MRQQIGYVRRGKQETVESRCSSYPWSFVWFPFFSLVCSALGGHHSSAGFASLRGFFGIRIFTHSFAMTLPSALRLYALL